MESFCTVRRACGRDFRTVASLGRADAHAAGLFQSLQRRDKRQIRKASCHLGHRGTVRVSNASGVNGNQTDNSAGSSGAAYVFVRKGPNEWFAGRVGI
jgi:hypothetical protein